jgi:hypothetical protein
MAPILDAVSLDETANIHWQRAAVEDPLESRQSLLLRSDEVIQ